MKFTDREQETLDKLVEAWNVFMTLPVEHPDDTNEFRFHLHALQKSIMCRPVRREINKIK